MKRGKFITFEGPDGCGKSTLARSICKEIGQKITCEISLEPTNLPIGKLIRSHLVNNDLPPQSFLFLFLADRFHHTQSLINPTLDQGHWMILDRYMDSTWAYQSAHCQLDVVALKAWTETFKGFLVPDRTYLLQVPHKVALERLKGRRQLEANDKAGQAFYEDVSSRFLALANSDPSRYRCLDATESITSLTSKVMAELQSWM
jgi:dTMP kinase